MGHDNIESSFGLFVAELREGDFMEPLLPPRRPQTMTATFRSAAATMTAARPSPS